MITERIRFHLPSILVMKAKRPKLSVSRRPNEVIPDGISSSPRFAKKEEISSKGTPFIVVAEAEKQKAYVRVVDGEEQSVSRFDVEHLVATSL